jgi:hypothetical protein
MKDIDEYYKANHHLAVTEFVEMIQEEWQASDFDLSQKKNFVDESVKFFLDMRTNALNRIKDLTREQIDEDTEEQIIIQADDASYAYLLMNAIRNAYKADKPVKRCNCDFHGRNA